ncbi:cupin domain-containing protein [Sphingomonas panacisoli]|nr:cupin domain-containing protein [Sphingomonas panacisoli]
MKQQRDTIFVPAGSAELLSILGMTHHTMITPDETDGQFTALVVDIPPECGPPMHSHATDSEFFYVLDGTLTLSDPDGDIEAGPGDFCFLRAGGSHAFRNATDRPVRALVVVTPGGDAHRFFKSVDETIRHEVDMPLLAELADRSGIALTS